MRRLFLLTLLLIAATPAVAGAMTLKIENRSSQPVVRLNTYPVDKDGDPVEDNLGALMEDIAPGATGTLEISMDVCGPVYIALGLGPDDQDLSTTLNTCKSRTLVVSD